MITHPDLPDGSISMLAELALAGTCTDDGTLTTAVLLFVSVTVRATVDPVEKETVSVLELEVPVSVSEALFPTAVNVVAVDAGATTM